MLNSDLRQLFDSLCCFKHNSIHIKCHSHSKHDVFLMFLGKAALLPPANVGWSINNGRISTVGQRQLEYELQKILTVGWGINYISHCCTLTALSHLLSPAHSPTSVLLSPSAHCQDFIRSPPIYFSIHVLALPISLSPSLSLSCSLSLTPACSPPSQLLSLSAHHQGFTPSRVHWVTAYLFQLSCLLALTSLYLALSLPIPWPLLLTHPAHLPSFHPICPLPRVHWVIGYISGFSLQGTQIFEYFPLLYLLITILHHAPSPPTSLFTSLLPLPPTLYCPLPPLPLLCNPLLLPTIHFLSKVHRSLSISLLYLLTTISYLTHSLTLPIPPTLLHSDCAFAST